jgi:hypothetical protein
MININKQLISELDSNSLGFSGLSARGNIHYIVELEIHKNCPSFEPEETA